MRAIIVGASGLIGSRLAQAAGARGVTVIGTYFERPVPGMTRFDLRDGRVLDIVPDLGPGDAVYLLSAEVAPDRVLADPDGSRRLNVRAAIGCLDDVLGVGAKAFFLSTEYVFDGRSGPYDEDDEPRPLSVYGISKLEGRASSVNALVLSRSTWFDDFPSSKSKGKACSISCC